MALKPQTLQGLPKNKHLFLLRTRLESLHLNARLRGHDME